MGSRPHLQDEVPHASEPKARWRRGHSTKRLASRYYQLKTGHARTGQYLH